MSMKTLLVPFSCIVAAGQASLVGGDTVLMGFNAAATVVPSMLPERNDFMGNVVWSPAGGCPEG